MDEPTRDATAAVLDAWRSGRIVRLVPARAGVLELGGAPYSADEVAQQALVRRGRLSCVARGKRRVVRRADVEKFAAGRDAARSGM